MCRQHLHRRLPSVWNSPDRESRMCGPRLRGFFCDVRDVGAEAASLQRHEEKLCVVHTAKTSRSEVFVSVPVLVDGDHFVWDLAVDETALRLGCTSSSPSSDLYFIDTGTSSYLHISATKNGWANSQISSRASHRPSVFGMHSTRIHNPKESSDQFSRGIV